VLTGLSTASTKLRRPVCGQHEKPDIMRERAVALKNPYYYENGADLAQDDVLTLAGITVASPGIGKRTREALVAFGQDILRKHGPRAFECPKRAAAIHEAGHVVINSVLGVRTTDVYIDHLQQMGRLNWIGFTESPETARPDVSFEQMLARSRIVYAGLAAEDMFAGDDRREGSSIDELFMSQMLAENAAILFNADGETLWKNDVWAWCLCQLQHNRDAHAEITDELLRRKRIKGKRLRELCSRVRAAVAGNQPGVRAAGDLLTLLLAREACPRAC
jgi:hypothetical protein